MFTKGKTDITLVFSIIFLIAFGVIMIYSASYYASFDLTDTTHTLFVERQIMWSLVGLAVMMLVSFVNYKFISKFWLIMYMMNIIFLILVLFQDQEEAVNGANRWLQLGPIGFQPSEFAKLSVMITLAVSIDQTKAYLSKAKALFINLLLLMIPVLLIMKEDLSTGIVMLGIGLSMLFVAIPKWKSVFKYIALGLGVLFGAFLIFKDFIMYFMDGYRNARIQSFLEGPWSDPLGSGYQTIQSLYAIGSGGLFGKGLGYSMQKNGFIPHAHNDIIFAIICEELGFFGAIAVMILFLFVIWRFVVISLATKETLGVLIITGVLTQIALQVIINIAVVTGTMPTTGMPLPFISYGGSSLVFLMVGIGMVLNVARQRKYYSEE